MLLAPEMVAHAQASKRGRTRRPLRDPNCWARTEHATAHAFADHPLEVRRHSEGVLATHRLLTFG